MDEIVLNRGNGPTMELNDEERQIMEEIQVSRQPKMRKVQRPKNKFRSEPTISKKYEEQEDLDAFVNPMKQQEEVRPRRPPPENAYGDDDNNDDDDDDDDGQYQEGMSDYGFGQQEAQPQPSKGYFSLDDEKADLLNKLTRLEKKGFSINKRLNAYSDVDEMRSEYKRIMYGIEVEQSIKFSRRMLVACTTGLEFLNKRYNPFELQLDGWSENIMENMDDYDGVFEELYAKYRTKMHMAPEVKLIMMLGGSAMMFHLTNSMFKAAIPNMNDVLKQNPDLVNSMMNAVKNTVPRGSGEQQSQRGSGSEEYEMSGPGIDLSQLMGSLSMPPPPPVSSTVLSRPQVEPEQQDDMSDIVSVSMESTADEENIKEVAISGSKPKRGRKSKKNEINL